MSALRGLQRLLTAAADALPRSAPSSSACASFEAGALCPLAHTQYHLVTSARSRSYAQASSDAPVPSEADLSTKDVYTILAEMMHKQASQAKKQDALKKDVQNVVKMMEGSVADIAEVEFSGTLRELLPRLSRKARNDLLAEFMQTEPLKAAQPALKDMMAQLQSVGEMDQILRVSQRYLEIVEGKGGASAAPLTITLTTAAKESKADLDAKKAMLVEDMQSKGQLRKDARVEWVTRVDPAIEGGAVYNIGDVMVDASHKALRDQFFHNLEQAGLPRVP